MTPARFAVGIDLGTTNSAVAFVDTAQSIATGDPIKTFFVQQLVAPGVVEGKSLLPSSLYFPSASELPEGATGVPWDPQREHVVGHLARALGSHVPSRLVHSAKSWLCHPDVDRRGPVLPWAAPDDVPHLSPVQASAEYLDHIREAWNHQTGRDPADRLEHQDVTLTVPASFDAVARQLTMEAVREAGLERVTLLEEPQAAFYCWIGSNPTRWRDLMRAGCVVLVCDIGGGTTDFTLIVMTRPDSAPEGGAGAPGAPAPVRVAVGDHLLLGGDNMDLALAHRLEPRLGGKKKLSAWEWGELVHACCAAKEELLRRSRLPSVPVSVLGRSSQVVGGTLSTALEREELMHAILDGFFPPCRPDDSPSAQRAGLAELGLPYAPDAAVTHHLARFLRDAAPAVAESLGGAGTATCPAGPIARPDVVLFNGGAFRPAVLRDRLLDVMRSWFAQAAPPGWKLTGVVNASPDLAVARGAAYAGMVRRGHGTRIAGGAARSYYLGLGDAGLGQVTQVVCVVPRGAEEEVPLAVPGRRFVLTLGQAVRFPLYASSVRLKDQIGDLLDRDARGLVALPALRTLVPPGTRGGVTASVELASKLTETGTLELACHGAAGDAAAGDAPGDVWKLELELRSAHGQEAPVSEVAATGQRSPEALTRARELVRAVYSPSARSASGLPKDPGGLRKRLEETLAAQRELWTPRTLRALFDSTLEVAGGRQASAVHEARWLNLTGFSIRPGMGFPQDGARIGKLWALFKDELRHKKEEENHREWWIMWRRAAAGLDAARQQALLERIAIHLLPSTDRRRQDPAAAERPGVLQEMWRLAASLEWADPRTKVRLGDEILSGLSASQAQPYAFWALARIGARWPMSGTIAHVVPADVAERWIGRVAKLLRAHGEKASFTLAHLARLTGDRGRDVAEGVRRALLGQLADARAPERHRQLVGEVVQLADTERGVLMGDSIPPGLTLA
jgi:molecular chaperone DnaK (HSP70)